MYNNDIRDEEGKKEDIIYFQSFCCVFVINFVYIFFFFSTRFEAGNVEF